MRIFSGLWANRLVYRFSVFAAAALGILAVPAAGLAASSCLPATEIDYLKPLKKLPPIQQLPANGHIPSSPQHLFVQSLPSLLAGGGGVGVQIGSDSPKGSYKLNWTVELTVRQISLGGSPRGVIGQRKAGLGSRRSFWSDPVHLQVRVPARSGLYRSDLTIALGSGSSSVFSQYIRVVPPKVDVRLHLGKSNYLPGEPVSFRLENRGTVGAYYGDSRWVEMWSGGQWRDISDQPEFFSGRALSLAPGAGGRCETLTLPSSLQSGSYRLAKDVGVGRKGRILRGYFTVS